MSSQPLKNYVSRGTQTDRSLLLQPSAVCDTPFTFSSNPPFGDEPATFYSGSSSENLYDQLLAGVVGFEGAYMQSRASEILNIVPPPSSLQNRKPASISCNHPSDALGPARRLVSLPNNPSHPNNGLDLMDRQTRIVSMPESGKFATLGRRELSQSAQTDLSLSTHAGSSDSSAGQKQQIHHEQNRTYPSDLPQTPSPPSSPESVMIVGNEPCVPSSYLRRSYTDDNGWITWASSPPRPIPALHGPLSLPYARCPSGAEGTLVEGDDLSHKIWGLGIDDALARTSRTSTQLYQPMHSGSFKSNPITTQVTKTEFEPRQIIQPSSFQRQSRRDAVIDISNPSTFYNGVDIPSMLFSHVPTSNGLQSYTTSVAKSKQSFPRSGDDLHSSSTGLCQESVWRPNHAPSPNFNVNQSSSNPSGQGQTRNGVETPVIVNSKGNTTFGSNAQNRLNKSAPVFVPASRGIDWRSKSAYNQQTEEYTTPDPLSRTPAFAQLNRMQQGHELISPPSTSSPRWSPVFPHIIDFDLSAQRSSRGVPQYRDPQIYSPHPDGDEYSNNLAAIIQQMGNQEFDNNSKRYPRDILRSSLGSMHHWQNASTVASNQYEKNHLSPTDGALSSVDRRHLSHHHPRSIPLARLIQRRLSSVTEEEAAGENSLLPWPRKGGAELHFKRPLSKTLGCRNQETKSAPTDDKFDAVIQSDVQMALTTTTTELQSDLAESNSIVKLPVKIITSSTACPSNVTPQNKGLSRRDENVHAKENDTNLKESVSTAGAMHKKLRTRRTKKSIGATKR